MTSRPASGGLSLRVGGAVIVAMVAFAIMGPLVSGQTAAATDMARTSLPVARGGSSARRSDARLSSVRVRL